MSRLVDLPPLTADEAAHSRALEDRIRGEIEARGGWIGFARFMELALYEPGLGYYSAGARKLGAAGDFVTAPEVAPVFSRCVARQCAEVLATLGGGEILEFGAGSGAMAAVLLDELARLGALPARYCILDVSADLRERQRATLTQACPQLLERVAWLDRLPGTLTGVMLANEVLDAMPVERFVMRGGVVNELGVTWQLGRLEWSEIRAGAPLATAVHNIEREVGEALPDGFTSELNLRLGGWFAGLARALTSGVIFAIDYGLPRREYYAAERRMGTMLCHYRHRFHDDPFTRIGLQDIGAWVDFSAAAGAAQAAGLEIAGFTTQAHFLIGCGIGSYMSEVSNLDLVQRLNLSRQAMLLTLPGEMGERFKALGLARGYHAPLSGFSVRDLRRLL
jgi:SAM-dependent MidA family methyltransferase